MLGAHEIIKVDRIYKDPNGEIGESNYPIEYLSKKERIAAFKKMAEFANKYDIEIKDELKYLNK